MTTDELEMQAMNVTVDLGLCNGYGHCVIEAPSYFDLDDSGKVVLLQGDVAPGDEEKVESAALLCPVQAITVSR